MADIEEKNNEVEEVEDAVADISSEENEQKPANVAGSVTEKAKGLNKKTIGIIAAAVVVLIVLCALLGGGKVTKEMKEQIQNSIYIQNASSNGGVKDLNLEYKAEINNPTQSKEEEYFVSGEYKEYSDQGQYVLIMLSKDTGDKDADWSVKIYGTYYDKARQNEAIKQVKEQKGSIDVEGEVQKYAEAMGDSATDIQLENTILYYSLGGNFRGKNYYLTAKTESNSAPGQYHNSVFVIEESPTGNFHFNVSCLYTGGEDEDLSAIMQNLLQNDTDALQNESSITGTFGSQTEPTVTVPSTSQPSFEIETETTKPSTTVLQGLNSRLNLTPAEAFDPADRLDPTQSDLERLIKILKWTQCIGMDYDSNESNVLEFIADLAAPDIEMEAYDLILEGENSILIEGNYIDPRGLFSHGYTKIQADVMEYYLENVFHNFTYAFAREHITDDYTIDYYYDNGWYYFEYTPTELGYSIQIRNHQLQANGHELITVDAIDYEAEPAEVFATVQVDATLTLKDGRRLWTIYSTKVIYNKYR